MNSAVHPLTAAAAVLDEMAQGRMPEHSTVLSAALALNTLCNRLPCPSRDLLDASAGLEILATGGSLDLDAAGRRRAADLADLVRLTVDSMPRA